MALNFFEVGRGLSIGEQEIVIFAGAGTGDLSGVTTDDAPLGSQYTDNVSGKVYVRTVDSANDVTDWSVQASEEYVDTQIGTQVSWREPALLRDNTAYADILAVQAAANVSDTLDGVTIAADDRVLITNLTTGNENVYIVGGSSGAWILTEDANTATAGDTMYILDGTDAGKRYTFNGTDWVQSDGSSSDELGYIRAFIGKDAAGVELPNYSSNFVVADNDNLEVAIGKLDASIDNRTYTNDFNIADGEALSLSLDKLDIAIGSRTYTNDFVVTDGEAVTASLNSIDTAFGDGTITFTAGNYILSDNMSWNAGTINLTAALDALNTEIGNRVYTENNHVSNGETITASIDALDIAIADLSPTENKGTNIVATSTPIDTIAHGSAPVEVRWMVMVRENATPARIQAVEIHALSDGTNADHTEYARVRTGQRVRQLDFNVDVSGPDVRLLISAQENIDYTVQRVHSQTF